MTFPRARAAEAGFSAKAAQFFAMSNSAGFCFTIRLVRLRADIAVAAIRPRAVSGIKLSKIGSSSLQNSRL